MACSKGVSSQNQQAQQQLSTCARPWGYGASCRCLHARSSATAVVLALPRQATDVATGRKQRLSAVSKRAKKSLKDSRPAIHHVITHIDVASDLVVLLDVKNQRLIYVVTAEAHEPVVTKVQTLLELTRAHTVWIVSEQGNEYAPLAHSIMESAQCNAWGVNSGANSFHPAQLDLLQQRIAPSPIDGVTIPVQRMYRYQDRPDTAAGRMRKPKEDAYSFSYMVERRVRDQQPRHLLADLKRRMKQLQNWLAQASQPVTGRLTEDLMIVRNRDLPVVWEQLLPFSTDTGRAGRVLGFLPHIDQWSMFERLSDEEYKHVEVFEPGEQDAGSTSTEPAREGEDKESLKQAILEGLQGGSSSSGGSSLVAYTENKWRRYRRLVVPDPNQPPADSFLLPEEQETLHSMSHIQQELFKAVISQARSSEDLDSIETSSEANSHYMGVVTSDEEAVVRALLDKYGSEYADAQKEVLERYGRGTSVSADREGDEEGRSEVDGEDDILELIEEIEAGQDITGTPHNAAAAAFYQESAEAALAAKHSEQDTEVLEQDEEGTGQDAAEEGQELHQPVGSTPQDELRMAMQLRSAQLRKQVVSGSDVADSTAQAADEGSHDDVADARPQGILAEFYDADEGQWKRIGDNWDERRPKANDFNCQMQIGEGPNGFTILMRITPHGTARSRGLSYRQRLEHTFKDDTPHMRNVLHLESQWQTREETYSESLKAIQPPPAGLQRGWHAADSVDSSAASQSHSQHPEQHEGHEGQQAASQPHPGHQDQSAQDEGQHAVLHPHSQYQQQPRRPQRHVQSEGQQAQTSDNSMADEHGSQTSEEACDQQPAVSQRHDDIPALKRPMHPSNQQHTSSSHNLDVSSSHDSNSSSPDALISHDSSSNSPEASSTAHGSNSPEASSTAHGSNSPEASSTAHGSGMEAPDSSDPLPTTTSSSGQARHADEVGRSEAASGGSHAGWDLATADLKEVARDLLGRHASAQETDELAAALAQAQGGFDQPSADTARGNDAHGGVNQPTEHTAPGSQMQGQHSEHTGWGKGSPLEAIAGAVPATLSGDVKATATTARPAHGSNSRSPGHSDQQGSASAHSNSSPRSSGLQGSNAAGSSSGSKGSSKGNHASHSRNAEHASSSSLHPHAEQGSKRSGAPSTASGYTHKHGSHASVQHDSADSWETSKESRLSAVKEQLKPKPRTWLPPSVASKSLSERRISMGSSSKQASRSRPKGLNKQSVKQVQDVMRGWSRWRLEQEDSSNSTDNAQGGLGFMQAARAVARLMEITHRPCDGDMIKKGEDVVVVIPGPGVAEQGIRQRKRASSHHVAARPAPLTKMLVTDAGVLEYQGNIVRVVKELVGGETNGKGGSGDGEGEGDNSKDVGGVQVSMLLQEVAASWNSWEQELMLRGTKAVGISARSDEDDDSDEDEDDD